MIILPKVKLEKVCADKNGMEALQDPCFFANKTVHKDGSIEDTLTQGTLAAANGWILAVLPVEHDDTDISGHIPIAAIKAALKDAKKLDAKLDASADTLKDRYSGGFPDLARIVRQLPTENLISISIDARKLYNLADALCERDSIGQQPLRYVRLTLSTVNPYAPILVEPCTGRAEKSFGALMPIHVRK